MAHLRRLARPLVAALALAVSPLAWSGAPAADAGSGITVATLTIRVTNTNDTGLACVADGAAYRLKARLVGPTNVLRRAEVNRVNVLVHDFSAGKWFWSMPGHPGFDYAANLARQGEVTLAIDRLGYDGSPLPDGTATCLGAQATMLHEVIQRLRTGRYHSNGVHPLFHYAVVHGHAVGAGIAELEAGMWGDVAGLVLMSWSDAGQSQRALSEAAAQHQACMGDDYGYFGQTGRDFRQLLFASAPLGVQRDAAQLRNPDPCGDAESLTPLISTNSGLTKRIDTPVLLLYGALDVLTRPDAPQQQAMAYSRSAHVTTRVLPGTGSALPLEASAPVLRRIVARWLCASFACGDWY